MRTIFISGTLGFICSHLVEFLLDNYDYRIIGIDCETYAATPELKKQWRVKYGIRYGQFPEQVQEISNIDWAFRSYMPDLFIHSAAESHVDNSIKNSLPFIETNIMGTHAVLEACKKNKIPLIHFSTDEVLKHKPPRPMTSELYELGESQHNKDLYFHRCKEDEKFDPSSPYSASKASAEMLVGSYIKTFGLEAKIVRPTNCFGPRQHQEKLIPTVLYKAISNSKIPVYGKGDQWRDWLYVQDFVEAFDLIMHKAPPGIYHVAPNNETQNIEIIKKILDNLGKSYDLIEHVEDRLGHDSSYSLNSDKIRRLGWKPKTNLEEGLNKTIAWYKEKYGI